MNNEYECNCKKPILGKNIWTCGKCDKWFKEKVKQIVQKIIPPGI